MEAEKIKTFGYGYYLKDLHTFLQNALGSDYVQTEKERRLVSTGRSIQFKYKGKIDVDLLVSPNWESQHDLNVFLSKEWPTADCQKYKLHNTCNDCSHKFTHLSLIQLLSFCFEVAGSVF